MTSLHPSRAAGPASHRTPPQARPVAAAALLLGGGGAAALLAPDGGTAAGWSAAGYRRTVRAFADLPAAVPALATELGLLVLGAVWLLCWWRARGRSRAAVAGVLLAGAGTVVAYGLSEVLKTAFDEQRPCRALGGVPAQVAAECPPPGDWSFPSNHATLAAALAVGLAVLHPRVAALVLPVGVATAAGRVAAGVHYPHDVLAGAVLGAVVVAALLVCARPAAARAVGALAGVPLFGPLLLSPSVEPGRPNAASDGRG
ncbi:phosphatase PAP2 family protein [Kitasatospora cheerisanensis]|uniref:Phosphatidic acid phosphatase type 2/haloperoxidase domain-containing protein n=1 Tax=Kitasatospora cheerisanensis KCTC 2395 TaxID=1348663 RepID=A0A066YRC7_9ACTN|nr:phosphatase PAP2 family protein [Kitasatospora cheerisanensis]KDN80626.1 hypothetical protein KCH_76020 [Kitasatospora cheerisanensis KCTC 2395]